MRTLAAIIATSLMFISAAPAVAAVSYTISGTFDGTYGNSTFMDTPIQFVGIGPGTHHSVIVNNQGNPLQLEEYDLSSLTAYSGAHMLSFSGLSFLLAQIDGATAVGFGSPEADDETLFAMTIAGSYDGLTVPFSAAGVEGLNADSIVARGQPFELTGGSDFAFSAAFVPEPSSWALELLGFGAAGTVLRRRRKDHWQLSA